MNTFPKAARLLKRWEFSRAHSRGKKLHGSFLVINCIENKATSPRLGLSVSTRFGNAIVRNRFKRLLREAFRLNLSNLPSSLDLSIKPRSAAKNATLQQLTEELLHLTVTL